MLQVTFRNVLPSEGLVEIAQHEYRRLHERDTARAGRISCNVTIAHRSTSEARRNSFRVQIEILRGKAKACSAVSEGEDVQLALRAGMAAAAGLASLAVAPRPMEAYA